VKHGIGLRRVLTDRVQSIAATPSGRNTSSIGLMNCSRQAEFGHKQPYGETNGEWTLDGRIDPP